MVVLYNKNDTQIYYDQWEDGYDQDIANSFNLYHAVNNPSGTQIWGDGDPSNGFPPGFPTDTLHAGDVIILNSAVVSTTRQAVIDFDGGDKIASTKPVAVTRATWASGTATLLAGANEVYDTAFWGTEFQCPVGVNIPDNVGYQMFEYTGLSIMAGVGGATVQVDKDLDGVFETHVLSEGEACLINGGMHVGGRVISDKPVQVDLLTGDIEDNYESRFYRLLPTVYWSSSLASPVATSHNSTHGTTVWLYNPGSEAIGLSYIRRDGNNLTTNTISVAGGGYAKQVLEKSSSGARFVNEDEKPFYALATIDSTSTNKDDNDQYDWGFALVPESSLTPQVLVGLGIGRDPTSSTNPNENGSPVWVTPIGNCGTGVTVYVDYNYSGDPATHYDPNSNKYNVAYSVKELEQLKIYNTLRRNQSGMLIYVLEPGVVLAAAWGAEPGKASTGQPGVDMGTGIPPFPLYVANKYSELVVDADNDGFVSPGDTLRYSIVIENTGRQPVTGLHLQDLLPPGITYITQETFFVDESSATNQIPDNTLPTYQTVFPLDEGGINLSTNVLPVRSSWTVHYQAAVNAYDDLPAGVSSLENTAVVNGSGLTITNSVVHFIHGRVGNYVWWDKNADGLQDLDEPGLNGSKVSLLHPDGSPVLGANGHPMTTVTSNDAQNAAGYYQFIGVKAGDYRVAFEAPTPQYKLTIVNSDGYGVSGALNSDADPHTGQTAVFSLAGGQVRDDVDAGFIERLGCISGAVRLDVNGNGVVDPEDTQGIVGVTVKLLDANSQLVAIAITTVTGEYNFPSVTPGDYTIVQVLPGGYANTYDVVGPNDLRIPVTLVADKCIEDNDFYVTRVTGGAIGDKVLYLSGPGLAMDRIDPVAASNTVTLTNAVGEPSTLEEITVVGAAASSTSAQSASTHSFSYFSGAGGQNRILLVGISYLNADSESITSVSFGTQLMTQIGTAANGTDGKIHIYRLLNPVTGSKNIVVNWSSPLNEGAVIGAITYAGVNQVTPTGVFTANTGNSTTPDVTVGSGAGQLVFGVVGGGTSSDYTVSAGATQLWQNRVFSGTAGSGQSRAGAASSVNLAWNGSASAWVAGGISVNPAPLTAGSYATFTQAPQFSLPFSMLANATVSVKNFINVTSGTMPANPDVTAYLSANGSTFLVLSNPTYDGNSLVWSGTLENDVDIEAGQAISLSVMNAESNVTFDILYDSSTHPSKVVLTTPSIIAIPSIGVYTASYAGGASVTNSAVLRNRYIRFTVTDPFGAYDITGASLVIDGPGTSGDITQSLGNSYIVASNSYSKTYEYLWQTQDLPGEYDITITADEGTEGIKATSETKHTLFTAAELHGYLFKDKDGNEIFDPNGPDVAITNALVSLIVDGITIATTNTSSTGYYHFVDVPLGDVTLQVVQAGATLVGVPTTTPDDQNPMRNRAVAPANPANAAVIQHTLAAEPLGEPLNFGYSLHPLSTQLGLRVYAAPDGRVMVEIATVNENGNHPIEVYAKIDGAWSLVATVSADQIVGFGSNAYTVEAFGLVPGASYQFRIIDESGHIFESGLVQVAHTQVAVKALTLAPEMIKLTFKTKPGTAYQVMVCEALGAPWKREYVQFQTARGLSELSDEPFTAGRDSTEVLVPRNRRAQAFFKIIQVQ